MSLLLSLSRRTEVNYQRRLWTLLSPETALGNMHNNLAKTSYDFSHIFAFLQLATLRSSKSFSFVLSLHYKIIGQVPSKHCPLPSTVSIVHITVTSLKNIPTPLHSPHSLNYSHLANLKHSTIFTQAAKCFWEK